MITSPKNRYLSGTLQAGVALLTVTSVSFAAMAAQGAYRAYYANDPVGRNLVTILSSAPLETMLTRTSAVEAQIKMDPANVLNNPQARFQIAMDTLDTGIPLRNEHMKGADWIDATKYPLATFTLTKPLPAAGVTEIAAKPGTKGEMDVEGELELHGVKKTIKAHVSVEVIGESDATKARLAGDLLHIRADFPLKMDDFGINIPAMAQTKVANVQDVKVDIFASTGSDAPKWAAQ